MKTTIATTLVTFLMYGAAVAAEPAKVVSGGVGQTSQSAVEEAQHNYNLKLVFTGDRGMYLADVNVDISDKTGKHIVSGVSDGPMLLAELQPGTYTVHASAEGYDATKRITVGKQLNTYQMSFPVKDNIEVSMAR